MADRRMFSKRIINSARFLKMPLSTQALYFHLGLNADDEGVVEAYIVINSINAAEDDLRVLVAKGFVQILNEDLVSYITDWNENNRIRGDRKKESIYKDLLLKLSPVAEWLPSDNQMTTICQPNDSVGKDRLGKVSIGKVSIEKDPTPSSICPYQKVIDSFNSFCSSYPKVISVNINRKKAIKARWVEYGNDLDVFTRLFTAAEASSFLKGKNSRNWSANFDWLMKAPNMAKVLEGNYDDKQPKQNSPGAADWGSDLDGVF